jgi:hypothetical protein
MLLRTIFLLSALFSATSGIFGNPVDLKRIDGNGTLARAVTAIRVQENAVRNIRIWTASRADVLDAKTGAMTPGIRFRTRSLYNNLPYGLCRINVTRETRPWPGGPAQWYITAFSVAYDGRVGTFLRTLAGTPKALGLKNSGRIMGHMPRRIAEYLDADTGWADTIFGFTCRLPEEHPRFSAFIASGQSGTSVRVRPAHWHGKQYLRLIRIGPPLGKDVFLLDPRRNFAIAAWYHYGWRIARRLPSGRWLGAAGKSIMTQFRVHGFYRAAPGVYFPKVVRFKSFEASAGRRVAFVKGVLHISKVVMNDPTVINSSYVIKFPIGAMIIDTSTDQLIRIGGTAEQQLSAIKRAVASARNAVRTREATRP